MTISQCKVESLYSMQAPWLQNLMQLANLCCVIYDEHNDRYEVEAVDAEFAVFLYFSDGLAQDEYGLETLREFAVLCNSEKEVLKKAIEHFEETCDTEAFDTLADAEKHCAQANQELLTQRKDEHMQEIYGY